MKEMDPRTAQTGRLAPKEQDTIQRMAHAASSRKKDVALSIGKLPNDLLADLIRSPQHPRPELLTGPAVGEDCAILDLSGGWLVATTDPITGSDKEIGRLGIHVSLNDLASAGAEPVAVLVTLLCPPGTSEGGVRAIMAGIRDTADRMHVALAGGHTEVTDAVTRTVLSVTALGRTCPGGAVTTAGARPGDALVMTKAAALEGTAILAREKEADLTARFGTELVARAQAFLDDISVVHEGRIAAAHGVHAMHDITEGGVLGAVWEMCAASGVHALLWADRIPLREETCRICTHFGLDPFRLISSGSMLMACADGEDMVRHLDAAGIPASVIGTMPAPRESGETEGGDAPRVRLMRNGVAEPVDAPGADELYRALQPA